MDIVELYYREVHGCYPFETDDNKHKSQKIIDYLKDSNVSEKEIIRFVEEAPAADSLSPELLPDWLWEGSLTKKGVFYFHNRLHLRSAPPTWNPVSGKERTAAFYLEMVLRFTMDDLLAYYYRKTDTPLPLRDAKRDAGAMNHLMTRYAPMVPGVDGLDFVLSLIDKAAMNRLDRRITNPLDLKDYEAEVYTDLTAKVAEAELKKANRIVWR